MATLRESAPSARGSARPPRRRDDLGRQAGALAAERERDRRARSDLRERAVAVRVERDDREQRRLAQRDHGHRVERPHARAHRARRERVGTAVGERDVRRAEALRRAQQRAEVARVGDAVELQPDLGSQRVAHERREVVGAHDADGAARVRERRERLHDLAEQRCTLLPAAKSSSAMRSLPRSSSTKTSTGTMPPASAARSASSPSSTKSPVRLRSLASPSARAALTRPFARLVIMPAPRFRQPPAPTRDARRPSRSRSGGAACPSSAPA